MDKLIQIAVKELGQKEIPGPQHNQQIIRYAQEAGFNYINDDETPWCSIFVNWCALQAGLKGSKGLNARSWLKIGTAVDAPEPGDVVVFWRSSPDSWKGHVGFFFGYSRDSERIYCLGGNQGNQVSISGFDKKFLLGFVRLAPTNRLTVPDKILKRGNKGDDVKNLQDALKAAGYNCGTSDGDFGGKTEEAVKQLQAEVGLATSAVFDEATRNQLISLLNQ